MRRTNYTTSHAPRRARFGRIRLEADNVASLQLAVLAEDAELLGRSLPAPLAANAVESRKLGDNLFVAVVPLLLDRAERAVVLVVLPQRRAGAVLNHRDSSKIFRALGSSLEPAPNRRVIDVPRDLLVVQLRKPPAGAVALERFPPFQLEIERPLFHLVPCAAQPERSPLPATWLQPLPDGTAAQKEALCA